LLSLFYISKLDKKALRLQKGRSVQKIPPVMTLENVDDENEISDVENEDDENEISDVESNDNQEKKRKSCDPDLLSSEAKKAQKIDYVRVTRSQGAIIEGANIEGENI
jgi:hypothetical protein